MAGALNVSDSHWHTYSIIRARILVLFVADITLFNYTKNKQ
jgi:hypothetical protein